MPSVDHHRASTSSSSFTHTPPLIPHSPPPKTHPTQPNRNQNQQLRRPLQVGLQAPRERGHRVGRGLLPSHARVLGRRLPFEAAKGPLPVGLLPPERLPVGHRLPFDPQRGRRVEAFADGAQRALGSAGAFGRPQPQVSGAERRLCLVHAAARRVFQEGESADRKVPSAVVKWWKGVGWRGRKEEI